VFYHSFDLNAFRCNICALCAVAGDWHCADGMFGGGVVWWLACCLRST